MMNKYKRKSSSNVAQGTFLEGNFKRIRKVADAGVKGVEPESGQIKKVNPITSPYGNCPNVSFRYKKQCRIGEGTYGVVYKAMDLVTRQTVALKRCLPHHEESDGFPITTLREIQILKEIKGHENIVQLKEVAVSSKQSGVFLVFDYAHFDLANLVDEHYERYKKSPFTIPETKTLSKQLLSAIEHLHGRCILHRDLKLSNLLYNKQKKLLKLCDFGLARRISMHSKGRIKAMGGTDAESPTAIVPMHLTPNVVSLWYRPPELLFHSEFYDFGVDMWGLGCVIAELLIGVPLFKGKNEMNQLQKIFDLIDKPSINAWPEMVDMPLFRDGSCELPIELNPNIISDRKGKSKFFDKFSDLSIAGIKLLESLLQYNPAKRLTATQAEACDWFQEHPFPIERENMPTFPWKK